VRGLVFWLAAAVLVTAPGASSRGDAGGPRDGHPCPGVSGFTCSTLTVPLDHSGKRSGTLDLAVATVLLQDGPYAG